jgi:hypothetical protein
MALAKFSPKKNAEAGVEVAILNPETDQPLGVFITVYGSDSEKFKSIQRRQTNRRLELAARNRGKKKAAITAEAIEAEGMELLVACTACWKSEVKDADGKVTGYRPQVELDDDEWLDCTPQNVQRLYEELPWLKEQIDQEIGDRSNFLQS